MPIKSAIFTFVRYSENSMVASIRIARWLQEKLSVPVIDQQNIKTYEDVHLDLLVIVNGAYGFCPCLAELAKLVLSAKRIVWVQNDFTIIPPKIESLGQSPFRAAFRERHERGLPHMDFWTTCADWQDKTPLSHYVNWNALTFDEKFSSNVIDKRRRTATNTLLYYGSYRNGSGKSSRVRYFDRYFRDPKIETVISSPAKQFAEQYGEKILTVPAIMQDFYDTLGSHGLGLYLEDRMSHERFHSPANRFYEMLSAGLPMVFQPEAEAMMARAGYKIADYIAHSSRSVEGHMKRREEIGRLQREEWIGDNPGKFRRVLEEQFNLALKAQKEALREKVS
jgi:hypothetical protein